MKVQMQILQHQAQNAMPRIHSSVFDELLPIRAERFESPVCISEGSGLDHQTTSPNKIVRLNSILEDFESNFL